MTHLSKVMHPEYIYWWQRWRKYRLTYEAGDAFKNQYLVKFSERESETDFARRKKITYVPAFAKAAVNEVKNAVFQRMADIARVGGSDSYQNSVQGREGGVDNHGASMNSFIGREVLPELLITGRVGIFVDMPEVIGPTLVDQKKSHPYLYVYRAEDIRSWSYDNQGELVGLLLVNRVHDFDEDTKLPNGDHKENHLYLWLDSGRVHARFYDDKDDVNRELVLSGLKRIPFVLVDINESLMADVADYQIAMMNLASSDLGYSLKSNFPFYIEQFDPRAHNPYAKVDTYKEDEVFGADEDNDGIPDDRVGQQKDHQIEIGASHGRQYPVGTEAPSFIHPSAEPLRVSMEKQQILKEEIRMLVNLAVSNIKGSSHVSAEAKRQDQTGLESGLSFIGLTLEQAEREIAAIWAEYERSDIASIKYPEKYSLRSEEDRRKDAENMADMAKKVPSLTYQREINKRIAELMCGPRTSHEDLTRIFNEIDEVKIFEAIPKDLQRDVELGILSKATASKIRGYPEDEAEKAKEEHIERATAIAEAQAKKDNAGSRGVPDLSVNPSEDAKSEKAETRDPDKVVEGSPVRGDGR